MDEGDVIRNDSEGQGVCKEGLPEEVTLELQSNDEAPKETFKWRVQHMQRPWGGGNHEMCRRSQKKATRLKLRQ